MYTYVYIYIYIVIYTYISYIYIHSIYIYIYTYVGVRRNIANVVVSPTSHHRRICEGITAYRIRKNRKPLLPALHRPLFVSDIQHSSAQLWALCHPAFPGPITSRVAPLARCTARSHGRLPQPVQHAERWITLRCRPRSRRRRPWPEDSPACPGRRHNPRRPACPGSWARGDWTAAALAWVSTARLNATCLIHPHFSTAIDYLSNTATWTCCIIRHFWRDRVLDTCLRQYVY